MALSCRPMAEAFILGAVRSPIGRFRGGLRDIRPDDLLGQVIAKLIQKTAIPGDSIDDVICGCANQAGEDNRNVARMALLLAGLPQSVPGVTVNRLCGSGLEAVLQAARCIQSDQADLMIAGGVESMTRAPLVMPKPDGAFPSGNVTMYDSSLGWRFPNPKLAAQFPLEAMGETAENLATRYGLTRSEQDQFALRSHHHALAAQQAGRFDEELVAIDLPPAGKGQPPGQLRADEGPRADTSVEKLGKLAAAFRSGGTVTAGNSSTLNDGAAAVLIGTEAKAKGPTAARGARNAVPCFAPRGNDAFLTCVQCSRSGDVASWIPSPAGSSQYSHHCPRQRSRLCPSAIAFFGSGLLNIAA